MIAIGACHMSGHMRELWLALIVQICSTVLYSLALSSLTACKTIAYAGKSVGLKCPIQHFVIQTWVLSLPKHSAASSSAFGTVCVLVTLQALTVSTITTFDIGGKQSAVHAYNTADQANIASHGSTRTTEQINGELQKRVCHGVVLQNNFPVCCILRFVMKLRVYDLLIAWFLLSLMSSSDIYLTAVYSSSEVLAEHKSCKQCDGL